MILVDTSIWVRHLRHGNDVLATLLEETQVLCHPFIVGELACGNLRRRAEILGMMRNLAHAPVADHDEVLTLIERHRLMGLGIGWIDAHGRCHPVDARPAGCSGRSQADRGRKPLTLPASESQDSGMIFATARCPLKKNR